MFGRLYKPKPGKSLYHLTWGGYAAAILTSKKLFSGRETGNIAQGPSSFTTSPVAFQQTLKQDATWCTADTWIEFDAERLCRRHQCMTVRGPFEHENEVTIDPHITDISEADIKAIHMRPDTMPPTDTWRESTSTRECLDAHGFMDRVCLRAKYSLGIPYRCDASHDVRDAVKVLGWHTPIQAAPRSWFARMRWRIDY